MEEVSIDATDIQHNLVGSVEHANMNSCCDGTTRSVVEGIFEDLMLGVRIEEGLDRRIRPLKGNAEESYVGNEVRGRAWAKTENLSGRWLRELGMDVMDTAPKVELAEVLVVLGELCPNVSRSRSES